MYNGAGSSKNMRINYSGKKETYSDYGTARRHISRWQWYLIVLILISPLLFIFYKIVAVTVDNTFSGVVYFKKYGISSPQNGYIKNMEVQVGSKVKKGDLLLTFESEIIRVQLKYLEKKLNTLKSRKKSIIENNNKAFESLLKQSEKYMHNTSYFGEKVKQLRKRGLDTIYNVHGAAMDTFVVLMSRKALQYNRYYYTIQIVNLEKDIVDTESQIAQIKQYLEQFMIKSPVDGEVIQQNIYQNEFVSQYENILLLTQNSAPYVKAFLPQKLISAKPLIGRKVDIYFSYKFFNKIKTEGIIIALPISTQEAQDFLSQVEIDTVVLIKVLGEIPENFDTYGFPVTLRFQDY